jgi:hypothetical protein
MFGMSCTSVSSIVTKGVGRVAAVPDIPYAYYTFDAADVTDTSILNRTSTFYDASLSSSVILDGLNNISGTTDLSLNAASSQFVTINSPMDIGKSTGLSILLWVRYGTTNSNGTRIFDFGNDPASDNIEMYIDAAGIPNLSIYSGSTQYTYSFGYPLNTNTYKHLGITMAADGTFQYYIDGVLYKTTTGNQYPADIVRTKNYIGKSSNNALFLNGGVGEFRIYNNVVSSAVVLNNMNTNMRLYTNSFMTHNYRFKYTDLQNGKIKNLVTGVYDASFLTPVDATFTIVSTTKQIGITTGTLKQNLNGTSPIHIFSRINSNFLYNIPLNVATGTAPTNKSVDSNYGVQILNGFTTPSTGGFSVNFWFYTLTTTAIYDLPFFSFNNGNTTASITNRITFGINSTVSGAASSSLWVNTVKDATNNKNAITATTTPGSYVNNGWHQYSLIVDYAAQTMRSYIDIDSVVFTHTYLDFSNTTFNFCVLMNDITYAGNLYNRPVQGFMDNFRIYNVPLRVSELRQLAQIPVTPSSRVYTLRPMATAAPVNGNVAVYMDDAVSRVYLSAGVGNLYVGNVSTGTWTQSTLAGGSSGQLENRNWRDIVCNSTGQYVVACAWTATINDPSGTVFYSSDYGSTFTNTASIIDTAYCFNLAMSADGNYTYMTAWGISNPTTGAVTSTGNLYTSLDKGITWSRITPLPSTVGGAATPPVGNPSWASIPSQVRCNSTGEYVILGTFSSTASVFLLNYGQQILSNPTTGAFGALTTNPVITNRSSDNALIASVTTLVRTSGSTYTTGKSVYHIANKTILNQNVTNTPIAGTPQTTSQYPWTGARNICMSQDRNQMVIVDTAGLGNVYVTTNGLQSAPWPDTATFAGIPATVDAINLSIPNAVSQTPVPRSAWSGVCVNWNDQFAFANKAGTVYLYTWTLQ